MNPFEYTISIIRIVLFFRNKRDVMFIRQLVTYIIYPGFTSAGIIWVRGI